ncbi:PSP1 domain-containing protein [Entomospira culicis]|uniref:PSP1 C-terminal domain-containing protein n=1 Tax=Entomospira culicis TaxID=2719989 RepID=A0A968KTW4_9SPIO|nr:regulatory iron-sulfur-containing complex subunit RicT [Entomospira culicis]NIZ18669.1 hypothetical protein [Entomospira culicis]NIZ68884.1 hypothetical protein [Entomospira culicis]WDI37477.1 regulatory iron-sulfur-containing complex subunit RicT [Entomospira culicis]WDI39105.1 regulatory iron-sulfur-containing complex subunit RicT [Entomospira culicis]
MKNIYKSNSRGEFFYLVKLPYIHEIEVASSPFEQLQSGDVMVADTRYGVDLVRVLGKANASNAEGSEVKRHEGKILRQASERDLLEQEDNERLAGEYWDICKKKIAYHRLEMKLTKVHLLLGKSKVLIFFTAEQRVDFRELVKDLVSQFHTRIELRQIGVRDETRAMGGLAMCGREYCCHKVNDQVKPASIKMVKDQELSLNSSKISGACGRLLCCLSYEYDYYAEVRDELPQEHAIVLLENVSYKVIEVHALTKELSLINTQDMAAKPLRRSAEGLVYEKERKIWLEGEKKSKKLVTTSCGCTRPEGSRCNGCRAKG